MISMEVNDVIAIISKTPAVVRELLSGLNEEWLHATEGPDTWSPHDIVAHYIFGEQTDWIPRMHIILSDAADKAFTPFDRNGHFAVGKGRSIESLLNQFEQLRKENIQILLASDISSEDLEKTGIHPAFGPVTLRQLLAAWAVHDMTHIHQLSRVIAKQYLVEVGPWREYMGVLRSVPIDSAQGPL
ncbi:MAG: DinB family protein [Saprospiraceae bacterium]